MASVSLTRIIEKMKLENLTPEISVKGGNATLNACGRMILLMVCT